MTNEKQQQHSLGLVDWFDLTSYGLSVLKARVGKDRDLLVMGSVDAHETQLIELGFRRVGAHNFRARLTESMLNMAAWRKAFPLIAKVKVHATDTFGKLTDSAKPMPEALRGGPQSKVAAVTGPTATTQAPYAPAQNATVTNMQNRDRSRAASVMQMQMIAMAPDASRLSFSRDPNSGAPMVYVVGDMANVVKNSERGRRDTVVMPGGRLVEVNYAVVEADSLLASHDANGMVDERYSANKAGSIKALNNGRVAGLQSAYARGRDSHYREGIIQDCELHGVTLNAIAGKRQPVLVRLYSDAANIGDMGAESNQSTALGLSPVEQAITDSRCLPDLDTFVVGDDGDVLGYANRDFVRGWLRNVGSNEAAKLVDGEGRPNKIARDRLIAAIFHRAYDHPKLIEALTEDAHSDIRNTLSALVIAAPMFAKICVVEAGGAIKSQLAKAVEMMIDAKHRNMTIDNLIAQPDLFGARDGVVTAFAKRISQGVRSPRRLGEALRMCAELIVVEQRATSNFELFARAPITAVDIYRAWDSKYDEPKQQQAALFGANPARIAAADAGERESTTGPGFRESEQDDDRRTTHRVRPGAFA